MIRIALAIVLLVVGTQSSFAEDLAGKKAKKNSKHAKIVAAIKLAHELKIKREKEAEANLTPTKRNFFMGYSETEVGDFDNGAPL